MGDLVIKVKRRDFWIAFSVIAVFVGVGFVVAYTTDGSGNPQIMGHSADEVWVNYHGGDMNLRAALAWNDWIIDTKAPKGETVHIPIATLKNWHTSLDCSQIPSLQFFQSACHRWCRNGCTAAGDGCNGVQDSGQSYLGGFAAEVDCDASQRVLCHCTN